MDQPFPRKDRFEQDGIPYEFWCNVGRGIDNVHTGVRNRARNHFAMYRVLSKLGYGTMPELRPVDKAGQPHDSLITFYQRDGLNVFKTVRWLMENHPQHFENFLPELPDEEPLAPLASDDMHSLVMQAIQETGLDTDLANLAS